VSKSHWFCVDYTTRLAKKQKLAPRFIQSEVKPKPIVTRSRFFSRVLRQVHVITTNFDGLTVLPVSFLIGGSDYFGFGFTTLSWTLYRDKKKNNKKTKKNN